MSRLTRQGVRDLNVLGSSRLRRRDTMLMPCPLCLGRGETDWDKPCPQCLGACRIWVRYNRQKVRES